MKSKTIHRLHILQIGKLKNTPPYTHTENTVKTNKSIHQIYSTFDQYQSQAGIKIAGRNINKLRYADDTTLMAESKEEIKRLLIKVKEKNEKTEKKLNIQKIEIMASGPVTSRQIDGEITETVTNFIFLGSKITAYGDCSREIKRCLLLGRKAMTDLESIFKSRVILCQQRSI